MTSTLRILHVISSLSTAHGGPPGAVRTMVNALTRRGVEVDVITTDDDGVKRIDVPYGRFVESEGQRVCFFPRQSRRYCVSYPLLRWLRDGVRNYDVVETHGIFTFVPVAAAWCARAAHTPYVVAPHGILDWWGMKNKSRLAKATSIRLLEGPLLRSAAAVHFMSEIERGRAAEHGLQMRPVVIPLGFDFDANREGGELEPIEELASDDRTVILCLARIHPIKKIDELLRAFAGLTDTRATVLAIAGDGDPTVVSGLKRLSSELGLDDRVRWLGFVSGARKRWLLSRAALLVLPSVTENFGVAVVEAMDAALPVIVTRGCGLSDLVNSSRGGVVTDGTVEDLRSALCGLLTNPQLRQEMGVAGRRAVHRELSLDAFGARLEDLYRSVATGNCLGAQSVQT